MLKHIITTWRWKLAPPFYWGLCSESTSLLNISLSTRKNSRHHRDLYSFRYPLFQQVLYMLIWRSSLYRWQFKQMSMRRLGSFFSFLSHDLQTSSIVSRQKLRFGNKFEHFNTLWSIKISFLHLTCFSSSISRSESSKYWQLGKQLL